jgi:hypothetical protein
MLRAVVLALAVAALVPAAARADMVAPELFVAETNASDPSAAPVWQPLASARLTGAYRYRLGVKVQASADTLKRQYVLVQAFSSPQAPEHGSAVNPPAGSCKEVRGNEGDIAEFGTVSYFGDGPYAITAAMAAYAAGPCPTSGTAPTSGTFTVDARPTLTFEGDPRSHDRRPAAGFRGVRVTLTADAALPEVVCARDPVVQPDGSLKGSVVRRAETELYLEDGTYGFVEGDAFPHAGSWSCVGRVMGGPEDLRSGWSTPISAVLGGDFAVHDFLVVDRTYPTYRIRFQVDRGAAGGTVSFRLRTCAKYSKSPTGKKLKPRTLRLKATVDERGRAIYRLRRKVSADQFGRYFVGRAQFSGTSLVPAGRSPNTFAFSEYTDSFYGWLFGVYTPSDC